LSKLDTTAIIGANGGDHVTTALAPIDASNAEDRARQGDPSALAFLRQSPDSAVLWRNYGDLCQHVENALIERIAGEKDLVFREGLFRRVAALKAELAGPSPTPLESLLVERIAASWLAVSYAEAISSQAKDASRDWADYYQRRLDRAHGRYLAAIRSLAVVRRLQVPAIQLNVAERQVNVVGGTTPSLPRLPETATHHPTARQLGNVDKVPFQE
jgi:hypothetical protein